VPRGVAHSAVTWIYCAVARITAGEYFSMKVQRTEISQNRKIAVDVNVRVFFFCRSFKARGCRNEKKSADNRQS